MTPNNPEAKPTHHLLGILALALVALLWGTTFAVVRGTLEQISPALILALRFSLAGLFFLPWLRSDSRALLAGAELGIWLFGGYALQTAGLLYTTASRSAFISALAVVLVPLLAIWAGRKLGVSAWLSVALALAGVILLVGSGGSPNLGDLLTVISALLYAIYILRLESYAFRFSPLPLTAAQLTSVALFSWLWVGFDDTNFASIPWPTLVYLGIFTTAATTWLQTWAQGQINAVEAAVIYSLEPVFGAIFAFWLLGETLGFRGWLGAALVIGATLIMQIPSRANNAKPADNPISPDR